MPADLHKQITNRIIEQIERGTPPWRQPWTDHGPAIPHNHISKRRYKGINTLLLWDTAAEHGYSNRWATYRQWQAIGYQVRRGERGTRIYFWRESNGESVVYEHVVFSAEQCINGDGQRVLPPPQFQAFINYEPAEQVIAATQADIHFGGPRAYYSIEHDIVVLPYKQCFESPEAYASVALHELGHWSGHPKRLNRFSKTAPSHSPEYAMEELIGEIASAFMAAELNIPNDATEIRSASYLATWLAVLKADSRAIVRASAEASRAANYVLSFSAAARQNAK